MLGLFNLGGPEVILILAAMLLLFGAKRLPELAKGLGQSIKEFKKATREVTDEIQNSADDNSSAARRAPTPNPQPGTQPQPTVPQSSPGPKV